MIIGLTGRIAAGKGQVVKFLEEKGFDYTTISQMIRKETAKRNLPMERKVMQDLGNQVRKEEGTGAWVKRLIETLEPSKDYIVDGIRNPGEIIELRKQKNFILISIGAPREIRFKRMIERAKPSDPKTWESFIEVDDRDFGIGEPAEGQQVGKCMDQADFKIDNDSTIKELNEKIIELYDKLKSKCY